jgi:hypothetical protein
MTCAGRLTLEMGLSLGQCDLNLLSVKAVTTIEHICGTPGTFDTPAYTKCRIRAIVSPLPEDDSDLYKALKVTHVKRLKY